MKNKSEKTSNIEMGYVLDFSHDAIIFVDNEFCLNYLNFKALSLFQIHHEKFKQRWGDFNPNDLIGNFSPCLFDLTCSRHDEMRQLGFGGLLKMTVTLDDLTFNFNIAPIFNLQGERLGSSIEIINITNLIIAKNILNDVIDNALTGDFSGHTLIKYPNEETIFKDTFSKISQLVFVLDNFMNELAIVFDAIAQGNLQTFFDTYNLQDKKVLNLFDLFKQDANTTIFNISNAIERLSELVIRMGDSIEKVWENNINFTRQLQLEVGEHNLVQEQFELFLNNLRNSNLEIQQACEFLETYSVEESKEHISNFSNEFINSIGKIGQATNDIMGITHSVQYILNTHLGGLKEGLDLIHSGSIGKGIKIISQESNLMVTKSTESIRQIGDVLTNITQQFNQTQNALKDFNSILESNINEMSDFVNTLRSILLAVNTNISSQNESLDNFHLFIQEMKVSKRRTVTEIRHTITQSLDVQDYINQIKDVVHEFKFNNREKLQHIEHGDQILTVLKCLDDIQNSIQKS